MLLDLRETVRNSKPIKYTLITIICIPFALFGVSSYFSGGGPGFVAKVGGEEISGREFEQAYNQQRGRLQQMFGGKIPAGFDDEGALRQQALESLVTQQVLRNTVADNNFAVSDKTLAQSIRNIPGFQADGKFDKDMYQRQIQSMGMSSAQFESSFRDDTALAQFRSGIVDTSFNLPAETEREKNLSDQIRKTDFLRFELEPKKAEIEVTDDEVSAYFDENAENYNFPQRVKIQYIELSRDKSAEDIEIPEADALAYYEDNRASYIAPDERKASHILLALENDADLDKKKAQLEEIKSRIEAGEKFSDLAAEFSTDVGSAEQGGSLGQFGRGAMVPEFDEAVFAMTEAGSLSEVIKTDFGVHLIQLDEVIDERGKEFEEVKDDVLQRLKIDQANAEYLDLIDILTEQSFDNAESLEPASDTTGLEVKTSDWIDQDLQGDPVLGNPAVLAAALSDDVLADGNNSEVLELGEKHVMVLRVLEHEEPRPKSLEDVAESIKAQLTTEKAGEALDADITTATAAIENGELLADIAEEGGATLTEHEEMTRTATVLDRSVVAELFKLPQPTPDSPVIKSSTLGNGDRVLLVLRELITPALEDAGGVESSEGSVAADTPAAADTPFDPRLGNAEFTALLDSLRDGAEVEINQQLFSGASQY